MGNDLLCSTSLSERKLGEGDVIFLRYIIIKRTRCILTWHFNSWCTQNFPFPSLSLSSLLPLSFLSFPALFNFFLKFQNYTNNTPIFSYKYSLQKHVNVSSTACRGEAAFRTCRNTFMNFTYTLWFLFWCVYCNTNVIIWCVYNVTCFLQEHQRTLELFTCRYVFIFLILFYYCASPNVP